MNSPGSRGASIANLLPQSQPPNPLPVQKEQAARLTETLRATDGDTLAMLLPVLVRLLESPTRHR